MNYRLTENFNDPSLDLFARLTGAQLREQLEGEGGIFIAESPTVIDVALDAGCEPLSLLTDVKLLEKESVKKIIEKCEAKYGTDFPVIGAKSDTLRTLTGFELTRGALCAMKRPVQKSVEELCKGARRIAVLEGITDSTNVGAIFRCAAALGIDAVLTTPTCCDVLCRRAVRVSMGTVFLVPFGKIGDTPKDWPTPAIDKLRSLGFKTCAMALSDDSYSIDDPVLKSEERLAIVLGTEGDGLKKSTIASCDYTVKIPMSRGVDSLNVAAAAAIAFWQFTH